MVAIAPGESLEHVLQLNTVRDTGARAEFDPLLHEMGLLPRRAGPQRLLEAAPRALRALRQRRLCAGAIPAARLAADLQALGAIAVPAHADARPHQQRQPLQAADR